MADELHDKEDNENSNENVNEKKNEPVNWAGANSEQCINYITSIINVDLEKLPHLKGEQLKNLSLTQQRAMAISAEGLFNNSKKIVDGKLPQGQNIVILKEESSQTVVRQFKELFTLKKKQKKEVKFDDIKEMVSDEDDDINELEMNNNMRTRYGNNGNYRNSRGGGRLRGRVQIVQQRRNHNHTHNGNGHSYGSRKRSYGRMMSENDNSNAAAPAITRGFEKVWKQMKELEFVGVRKFGNKNGEIMYFWWKNGRPMASTERPIGYADGDNINDPGFQDKMKRDKFFGYNRRRPTHGRRNNRVCNYALCIFLHFGMRVYFFGISLILHNV